VHPERNYSYTAPTDLITETSATASANAMRAYSAAADRMTTFLRVRIRVVPAALAIVFLLSRIASLRSRIVKMRIGRMPSATATGGPKNTTVAPRPISTSDRGTG